MTCYFTSQQRIKPRDRVDFSQRNALCLLIKKCVQYRQMTLNTPVAILIIKISLLLIFTSLSVFISADLLLWLAMPVLAGQMTGFGLAVLLSAFALLLSSGFCVFVRSIISACCDYFSAVRRLQRKLLFVQAQQDRFKRLFYFRALQINYFYELKRKRLSAANDRRHILSLSKAIDKDLRLIKQQLSKPVFQELHKKNVRYRDRQDIVALLELQQKISTIF
jgi:hypothetical protein